MDQLTKLRIFLLKNNIPANEIDNLSFGEAQEYCEYIAAIEKNKIKNIINAGRFYITECMVIALRDVLSDFFGKGKRNIFKKFLKNLEKDMVTKEEKVKENDKRLEELFNFE